MIAVIQRVTSASVEVSSAMHASIGPGLLVLVGIEDADGEEDIKWLSTKVVNLRIFNDESGIMNKSLLETGGDIMMVSQFTLHASTRKGNRPSYLRAAKPAIAIPLYESVIKETETALGRKIQTGVFGADMKVSLVNDGPVTIIIDTKNRV